MDAQMDGWRDTYERAAMHAKRAGRPYEFLGERASGRYYGTMPVSELLAWLDERGARGARDRSLDVRRSLALAMLGRFDEARSIMGDVRTNVVERGGGIRVAGAFRHSVDLELLCGDPAAAAEFGQEAMRLFDEMGSAAWRRRRQGCWPRRSMSLSGSTSPRGGRVVRQSSVRAMTS
jgi:hypothetical protein